MPKLLLSPTNDRDGFLAGPLFLLLCFVDQGATSGSTPKLIISLDFSPKHTRHTSSRCISHVSSRVATLPTPRQPSNTIYSILIANSLDDGNQWTEIKLSRGSWVLMNPRPKRRINVTNAFRSSWKGRVIDFKVEVGRKTIKEILIQHVYTHHDHGGDISALDMHRANYVYPSSYEEWQPVECIIGIYTAVHAKLGKLQYEGRSHKSLANNGIYFYDHFYKLSNNLTSGTLIELPIEANWNAIDWPVPDLSTVETFRCKVFREVQRSLKEAVPTKSIKISLFSPVTLFVELFHRYQIRVCNTMFLCKGLNSNIWTAMFDKGWDTKQMNGIISVIAYDTLVAKYMIATQTFIMSFWYKRSRLIAGELVPMDQESASVENNNVINLDIWDAEYNLLTVISLREQSTLKQLRADIIDEATQEGIGEFDFLLYGRKLMRRREQTLLCCDLPGWVRISPC